MYTAAEDSALHLAARTERDQIIVTLLNQTGLRAGELVSLDVTDLVDDPVLAAEGPYIRVRKGKGRRGRVVPLEDGAYGLVRHYVDVVRPLTRSPALFVTHTGRSGAQPSRLTYGGLRSMLRRLGGRTQVHAFAQKGRHTFATRSTIAGHSQKLTQEVMGQRSPSSFDRYLNIANPELVRAWRMHGRRSA